MTANVAQAMIDALVSREVPVIQVFDGKARLLKTMEASDHMLILVYWAGEAGVDRKDLTKWLPPKMQANIVRTVTALHDKHLLHFTDPLVRITTPGRRDVEARKLIEPV